MPEHLKTQPEPWTSPRFLGRLFIAFLLAEAVWFFLVSLTTDIVLPLLARLMGGDPSSPLYLGKNAVNVPAFFSSFVELCLAGIVVVVVNSWWQDKRRVVVRQAPASLSSAPRPSPSAAPVQSTEATKSSQQPISAAPAPPPKTAAPPAQVTTAAQTTPPRPKKAQEVYYNLVGEPITPEENQ